MVHEQSACTHTSLAHAVARFQIALARELEGILKSQVSNHLTRGGSSKCVSLVLQCHIWLQYFPFGGRVCIIYSHDALYRLSIATLSLKACLVLMG